jgi:hypothetical protein
VNSFFWLHGLATQKAAGARFLALLCGKETGVSCKTQRTQPREFTDCMTVLSFAATLPMAAS